MKKTTPLIGVAILVSICLLFLTVAVLEPLEAQSEAADLFLPAPAGTVTSARAADARRSRAVTVDWDNLLSASTRIGQRVTLNLFDDAVFVAQTHGRAAHIHGTDGYTWIADIEGNPNGEAILSVENGHVEGYVSSLDRLYRITTTESGQTEIRELTDEQRTFEDQPFARPLDSATPPPATEQPTYTPAVDLIIDVMVVYTPTSRDVFGGATAIRNAIYASIEATNLFHERSGVNHRLRLVHIAETSYTASGNAYLDLQRITNSNSDGSAITGNDGHMDDVPVMRNTYGADIVTAIIEINQPNGVAWQMLDFDAHMGTPFSEFAYSIIGSNLLVGGLGYAHEFGHLLGATHNPEDAGTFGVYIDSFGYRDPGYFRTIMSYTCRSPLASCPLINRWSDPAQTYNNRPLGNVLSNEVKTLNFTAPFVENFRVGVAGNPPTAIPPFVPNDWWANATPIGALPATFTQNIAGATTSTDSNLSCSTATKNNGVWFTYTPVNAQQVVMNTNGSAYNTVMGLYSMGSSGLTSITCNDDISAGLRTTSALSASLSAGVTYFIQVAAKSDTAIVTATSLTLTIQATAPSNTKLIENGDMSLISAGNPNLPASWGVFASPTIDDMEYHVTPNGVFEFLRESTASSAVVLQNTSAWLPQGTPIEITADLGNSSAQRKRIVILAHAADFSDLQVCNFWLEPNAPMRTYTMRTFTNVAWMPASVSIYASVADGTGWYQVDNVDLRHIPTLPITSTRCIDPTAPPATTSDATELLSNGAFTSPIGSADGNWGAFALPSISDMVYQQSGGVFEYYRTLNSTTAVVLQNSGDAMIAGDIIEARFSLGNNSAFRKRITVLLHASDFSDLQVCTFWLAPNSNLNVYTMRTHTTRAWANASLSFYASTADNAGWARIDNVSLKRLPNVAQTGTDCYTAGTLPSDVDGFSDSVAPIAPTLEPTATAFAAPAMPSEATILSTPTPTPEANGEEGNASE